MGTMCQRNWRVSRVTDRGPGNFYRFLVTGENLNFPPGHMDRKFVWSVPDLDAYDYDLSGATWSDDKREDT